jgi:hypothetical protein
VSSRERARRLGCADRGGSARDVLAPHQAAAQGVVAAVRELEKKDDEDQPHADAAACQPDGGGHPHVQTVCGGWEAHGAGRDTENNIAAAGVCIGSDTGVTLDALNV